MERDSNKLMELVVYLYHKEEEELIYGETPMSLIYKHNLLEEIRVLSSKMRSDIAQKINNIKMGYDD